MRSPILAFSVPLGILLAGISAAWLHERHVAAKLLAQVVVARAERRELDRLDREHDALITPGADLAIPAPAPPLAAYSSHRDSGASRSVTNSERANLSAEPIPTRPEPLFNPRVLKVEGMKPVSAWSNVGQATPEATLETQSWAFARGDFALAARTLRLDDDARAKVEAFLNRLETEERVKYESPEQIVALLLGAFEHGLSGLRFTAPVVRSADDVVLWTLWTYQDGHSRERDVHLQRSAQGWQRLISDPEDFIGHALAQLEPKSR